MTLSEEALLTILQNENKMEEYLQQFGEKPSAIDPVIWQVHLSVPLKKRMKVLNAFFEKLMKKYKMLYSFLPEHLILAKVYKTLSIPYSVTESRMCTAADLIVRKKISKSSGFGRYIKVYNSSRKTINDSDLGIYEFKEESSGHFIPFAEFRKECKKTVLSKSAAEDVLDQLSKLKRRSRPKFKTGLDENMFFVKSASQQVAKSERRPGPAIDTDSLMKSKPRQKTDSIEDELGQREKSLSTFCNNGVFEITPKHAIPFAVSLNVAKINSRPNTYDATDEIRSNASLGIKNPPSLSQQKSYLNFSAMDSILKSSNASRVLEPVTNDQSAKIRSGIQLTKETEILLDQTPVDQNVCERKNIFKEKISIDEKGSETEPTVNLPIVDAGNQSLSLSDREVVISSSCSEDFVASEELNIHNYVSANVNSRQIQSIFDEKSTDNSSTVLDSSVRSSLPVSNNSIKSDNAEENLYRPNTDKLSFDRKHKRSPLDIKRQNNFTVLDKDTEKIHESDGIFEELQSTSNTMIEGEDKNYYSSNFSLKDERFGISDSENNILSPLAESVIITQRSNGSESPVEGVSNSSIVLSQPTSQISERINEDKSPIIPETSQPRVQNIVNMKSDSGNATAISGRPSTQKNVLKSLQEAHLPNERRKSETIKSLKCKNKLNKKVGTETNMKKLTDFVTFKIQKRRVSYSDQSKTNNYSVNVKLNKSEDELSTSGKSTGANSPESTFSLKQISKTSCRNRHVKRLYNEAEEPLSLTLETQEQICLKQNDIENESVSLTSEDEKFSRREKVSNSDNSSAFLSQEFETLSLISKKSEALFPSQSGKISTDSVSNLNFLNSSQTREITIDHINNMMKDIPNTEEVTSNTPSQVLVFSDFPSSHHLLEKRAILEDRPIICNEFSSLDLETQSEEFKTKICSQNFCKDTPLPHHPKELYSKFKKFFPSSFSQRSPSARCSGESILVEENLSSDNSTSNFNNQPNASPCFSENGGLLDTENVMDEFFRTHFNKINSSPQNSGKDSLRGESQANKISIPNCSKPSFTPKYSSINSRTDRTASKEFSSSNFKDRISLANFRSLPIENRPLARKHAQKRINKKQQSDMNNTSDEEIFRDRKSKSFPLRGKRESSPSATIQLFPSSKFRHRLKKSEYDNKENQIREEKEKRKKRTFHSQRSLVAPCQNVTSQSNSEKMDDFQKSNTFGLFSDDDYESDELNSALNNSLSQFNNWTESQDAVNEETESVTSQNYDDEIAQLLNDYAALNAERQSQSHSSGKSHLASTSFISTLSVKSNSQLTKRRSSSSSTEKQPTSSNTQNYKDIMWNSYPDSLDTALTTPDEKLEEVRTNLKEKFSSSNLKKSLVLTKKSKSSKDTESDSFSFLDWD